MFCFSLQEIVPTFIKEVGGTMLVLILISMEYGTEEDTTEANTRMGFFGPNTEEVHIHWKQFRWWLDLLIETTKKFFF